MNNFSRRKFLLGSLSAPIAVAGASFVSGCSKKQSDAPHGIGIESVHEKLKHDRFEYEIGVVDSHTEGEFCRIAFDGFPEPKGNSVMEKKKYMQENYDNLRKALMLEPRGHRNMFGAFLC